MRKKRIMPPDTGGDHEQLLDEPLPVQPSHCKTYAEYLASAKPRSRHEVVAYRPPADDSDEVRAAIERVRKAVGGTSRLPHQVFGGGRHKAA